MQGLLPVISQQPVISQEGVISQQPVNDLEVTTAVLHAGMQRPPHPAAHF